jgi:hypothetical protein
MFEIIEDVNYRQLQQAASEASLEATFLITR